MKFLIEKKPKIHRSLDGYFFIAGNNLFTRIAKKKGYVNHIFPFHSHLAYSVLEDDFHNLLKYYNKRINERKRKFLAKPLIIQITLLLRYIFNRNKRAKVLQNEKAIEKAYEDKQYFLTIVFEKIKEIKIKYDWFNYGYLLDDEQEIFKYLYIFQIEDKQISFHSEFLFKDFPKIIKEWNGTVNNRFPFKIIDIKRLLKDKKEDNEKNEVENNEIEETPNETENSNSEVENNEIEEEIEDIEDVLEAIEEVKKEEDSKEIYPDWITEFENESIAKEKFLQIKKVLLPIEEDIDRIHSYIYDLLSFNSKSIRSINTKPKNIESHYEIWKD